MMTAPKRKRGRPPLSPEQRRVRRQVTVKRRTWDRLEVIGGGNHSAGIDLAVEGYDDLASPDTLVVLSSDPLRVALGYGETKVFRATWSQSDKADDDNPDYNNLDYSKETP